MTASVSFHLPAGDGGGPGPPDRLPHRPRARERGWTVLYRLSDNDIGVTRKDPTKPGKYRPGYEEAMRLVDARAVDAVLCFKWDRFIREPLDLEYLIPRFDQAGVRFAEVDGNIDLGTDSGRLAARILIAVAKAEQERKAERQKLANEQAAINGRRFTGGPRPFGYREDHVTAHPVEGPAVAEACAALLGGGTVSGVMREWTRLEPRQFACPAESDGSTLAAHMWSLWARPALWKGFGTFASALRLSGV